MRAPTRARTVLGLLVLAVVVVVTGALPWTSALVDGALAGPGAVGASGGQAAPLVPALGLVALAGAGAASTTRRVGTLLALAAVGLAGVGVVVGAATVLLDPAGATSAEVGAVLGVTAGSVGPDDAVVTASAWPAVAGVAGAGIALLAALGAAASSRWTGGRRYEPAPVAAREGTAAGPDAAPAPTTPTTPAAPSGEADGPPDDVGPDDGDAPAAERARRRGEAFDAWDALSRGEDPTGGSGGAAR